MIPDTPPFRDGQHVCRWPPSVIVCSRAYSCSFPRNRVRVTWSKSRSKEADAHELKRRKRLVLKGSFRPNTSNTLRCNVTEDTRSLLEGSCSPLNPKRPERDRRMSAKERQRDGAQREPTSREF